MSPSPNSKSPTTPPPKAERVLLVNVRQAAEILCLSRSSIYQLIWTDKLNPIRIGRSVRFSVAQLEQFVAARHPGQQATDDDGDESNL